MCTEAYKEAILQLQHHNRMKTFPTKDYTSIDETTGEPIQHYNDLYLDSGNNIAFVSNLEALKHVVENVVRTQFGELQLNSTKGIPYFETIFSSRTNVDYWKAYMIDAIESVDNVDSCELFEIDISEDTQILTYRAYIKSTFGEFSING